MIPAAISCGSIDASPSGWVFLQQKPLVIADVHREDRWPNIMQLLLQNNVVTSCWLPLTTAQHRLGALVLGFGSPIDIESQMDFMLQIGAQVAVAVDNTLNFEKAEKYQRQLARDHIRRVLEKSNWVVGGPSGAATRLGMKRTTLQSKMKKLGISR